MQFRTASNANGGPETFTWTVTDNGTTDGGADPLSLAESLTITVNADDDTPTIGNNTLNLLEAETVTLSSTDSFRDRYRHERCNFDIHRE